LTKHQSLSDNVACWAVINFFTQQQCRKHCYWHVVTTVP